MSPPLCRLYLITPPRLDDLADFGRTLAHALDAGDVAALQIRLKDVPDDIVAAAVDALISGTPAEAEAAAQRLGRYHFVSRKHCNQIVTAYPNTVNPAKRTLLERTYKEITGDELEWRYQRDMFD